MKLYVCCALLLVAFVSGGVTAPAAMEQPGASWMMMPAMMDEPMQDQQPLTFEDMVAVYDQGEMDMGDAVREKRHHRGGYGGYGGYRGGYGGGYGGYGYGRGYGGYGGYRGGYGGYHGGYRRGGFY